jgi:RHS repeat-associated protein
VKSFFRRLVPVLSIFLLFSRHSECAVGNDNPTGPAGEYNGSITTGGSYDPYTGNAKRFVDDLTVTGSVGAYPLKWTRVLNTRGGGTGHLGLGGSWSHSYQWGLWVRPYEPYQYYPNPYEGPGAVVTYPDGRTVNFAIAEQPYTYFQDPNIFEPQDRIIHKGGGNFDLLMRDGGRVIFKHPLGSTSGSDLVATEIVDPYGQSTLLARDGAGRLSRVTEPEGRYLQINYTTFSYIWQPTGETLYTDVISSVQSFSAPNQLTETVTYGYTAVHVSFFTFYYLTQVNYADSTQASYTYIGSNVGDVYRGVLQSCNDVRFAGPMKKIEYEYMVNDGTHQVSWGQIKREKNATTHQVLSEVTYPLYHTGPLTGADFQRTETRGDGASRSFQYTNDGHAELVSYTDFKGQSTQIDYPPMGFGPTYRRSVTDARGNTTSTDLELNVGATVKITHPDDSTITFAYSDPTNPYYLVSKTDECGYPTSFTRDPINHQITRTDYPDTSYETFTYNGSGQVLTHKMTKGGTESFIYDGRGLKTTYTDPLGKVTLYQYYTSGPNTDRVWKVTDPLSHTTTYEYNLRGQVTKLTRPDGSFTQTGYNPDGSLAWASDELGHTTSYTYDEYKRVLTTTDALNHTTTNSYALDSAWANPLLHTTTSLKYVNSPSGKNTVFDYDANFRKIDQVAALGTPDEAWTLFEYDEVGNLIKTTDPRFKQTSFGYDDRDRQVTVTDALNQTTSTMYDLCGNKKKVTHPDAKFVQYFYDSMDRPIRQIDERNVTTTMGYDSAGNLAWNRDGNNNLYSYTYDNLNRRTVMTYPNTATEKYQYDAAGNLQAYTNRAGDIQTFLYDNRNRQTRFDWDDGVTPWQTTAYDAASRVTQITNANATIKNLYFDDNSLKSQEEWTVNYADNFHRTVTYAYDADGNRANITYPSGKDYSYGYTGRNQLWYVLDDLTGIYQAAYGYDLSGNMTTRQVGNNWIMTDASQRDAINQLKHLEHRFVGGTRSFDHTFNPRGSRLTSKPDGGTTLNYAYDASQEVTSAPLNGGAQTFGYDNNGNRTSLNGGGVYASNNLNQYTTFSGLPAIYDLNGNLKSYNGWTYTYDAQNRLKTVLQGTTTVATYWYDGLNRQITRNVNNVLTFHVWDGWNVIEERGTGNALQNVFLYGAGEIVENVTTKRFFFQDSLGNTSHLSDEAGNLLEFYTYSAFGQPKFYDAAGNPSSASTKGTRHLFQGQLWTQQTGLNDYRNRVELPTMGVFMQPDPIGFKGDAANIYRFCSNNAVNRTDPLGLIVVDQRWSGLMYMQGGAQMSFAEILKAYRDYPAGVGGSETGGAGRSISAENEGKKRTSTEQNSKKETGGSQLTITRSLEARKTSHLWGVHRVDLWWKYVVTDASGNPVPGLHLHETIKLTNKKAYFDVNKHLGDNTTDAAGSVPDHYQAPFGLPFVPFYGAYGHVTVNQTISTPGGGQIQWKTTVYADGHYTTDTLRATFQ